MVPVIHGSQGCKAIVEAVSANLGTAFGSKVVRNAGWLVLDKMVRLVLGLLVGSWVARYLGPSQFGEMSYIISFLFLLLPIATISADSIIVRDLATTSRPPAEVIATAGVLRLVAGLVCWVIAIAGGWLISGGNWGFVLKMALAGGMLVFQAADVVDLWFQSQSKNKLTVVSKLIGYLISNVIKIIFILYNAPLTAFLGVVGLEAGLGGISLLYAYQKLPVLGKWETNFSKCWVLMKEAWPYTIGGLAIIVYTRIDQIMMNRMLGNKELGIYAAALPISQLWSFIPVILVTSLAPLVAIKKMNSTVDYYRFLSQIFRFFGGISLILSFFTALVSNQIIHILYGNLFSGSAAILKIHVFSNFFVFQGVAQNLWYANEGKGNILLYKALLGGILAIVGNYFMLPIYGPKGAAFSVLLSFGVSGVLSNLLFAPKIFIMQCGIMPRFEHVK